jgi:deazaflavin-dependent oxidoreductase (nitroreductase family)
VARLLNSISAAIHARGVAPNYMVTLEVVGRRSGRSIRLPLVMVTLGGERYLVSMLGADVGWVHNVRAAGGDAVLLHGRREAVHLEELPVGQRAPVLKLYLQRAPGARAHIPVDRHAPLDAFERVAAWFPVYRVSARATVGASAALAPTS